MLYKRRRPPPDGERGSVVKPLPSVKARLALNRDGRRCGRNDDRMQAIHGDQQTGLLSVNEHRLWGCLMIQLDGRLVGLQAETQENTTGLHIENERDADTDLLGSAAAVTFHTTAAITAASVRRQAIQLQTTRYIADRSSFDCRLVAVRIKLMVSGVVY